jgi:two-component system, NarL family, sensor kinase
VSTTVRSADSADTEPPPRPSLRRRPGLSWLRGPRRELLAFVLSALVVLVAVSAGAIWVSQRSARATALAEAERISERLADELVAPVLRQAIAGVPGAWQRLNRDVTDRMSDGSITSVEIWTADGTILYSTEGDLGGTKIKPTPELTAAINGTVVSDIDESPETAGEGDPEGPQLEVYVPVTVAGSHLAIETYLSDAVVHRQAALVREKILPPVIAALIVLQLVQIPIAVSLARRVRRQESERVELTRLHLAASDEERRAVAADVHDGPVQDLAGVGYALSALRPSVSPERQPTVDHSIGAIRHAVASLRQVMVDINPPDLSGPGLGAAITEVARPLRERGLDLTIDTEVLPEMSSEAAAVLYRTAKEAVANVRFHARATRAWITLELTEHRGAPAVRLEVADDGVGYPPTGTRRPFAGGPGLQLLCDRVTDLGGTVDLGHRMGGGAVVTAVVPTHGR